MSVCCTTQSKVKVKVTDVQESCENGWFQSISSAGTHAIKRLTVNYGTTRRCVNFVLTDVWYSSQLASRTHVTFKVRPLRGVDRQSCMGLICLFSFETNDIVSWCHPWTFHDCLKQFHFWVFFGTLSYTSVALRPGKSVNFLHTCVLLMSEF